MPIIKSTLPPALYRGTIVAAEVGDYVLPAEQMTAAGDKGSFVFASDKKGYAETYFFRKHGVASVFRMIGSKVMGVTILAPRAHDPDADIFDEALSTPAFLQEVDKKGFKAVVAKGTNIPIEWVHDDKTKILSITALDGHQLIADGLQVFRINSKIVRERLKASGQILPEDPKTYFVDSQTGREIRSMQSPIGLYIMMQSGVLVWENLRPEFDGTNARPVEMLDLLGLLEPGIEDRPDDPKARIKPPSRYL